MVTKSRRPSAPAAPKAPARTKAPKATSTRGSATDLRDKFVLEYLVDRNATQAAIRAGASPRSAHAVAHKWLKRADIVARIAAYDARTLAKLDERYEARTDQILREMALIGMSNMADYFAVDDEGHPVLDLSEATRDHFAAIGSIKTKRTTRYRGTGDNEERIEDVQTELRLAPKQPALADLARIRGMMKDGGDVVVPVRFITIFSPNGPRPELYPDEEEAA